MSDEQAENDLSMWFSTYGLITAERILEKYKIRLQQGDLLQAIKNPHSFYHQLLRVPLRNVFNGIILQQTHDYQVYAQKLFIDYLISGETGKSEESPGGLTREDLERERQKLIGMGEAFREQELNHERLIAASQSSLIKLAEEWKKRLAQIAKNITKVGLSNPPSIIIQALNILLIMQEKIASQEKLHTKEEVWLRVEKLLGESLSNQQKEAFAAQIAGLDDFMLETVATLEGFSEQILQMGIVVRKYRTDFYNIILRINDLIKLLPEYRVDPVQTQENRESLHFDTGIGEN